MKHKTIKKNNPKKITYSSKKQKGGLFGFGNKSQKNPKQKFNEVLNTTFIKVLEYRVTFQRSNHDKLLKLTKELLTLDPTNYRPYIDKIVNLSTTKTNNYNNYLSSKNWKKLISKSEESIIRNLATQQLEEHKTSYTDTIKTVESLANLLVNKFNSQTRQSIQAIQPSQPTSQPVRYSQFGQPSQFGRR